MNIFQTFMLFFGNSAMIYILFIHYFNTKKGCAYKMTHPFCMILYLYLPTVGTYFMYVRMYLKMSYSPDIDKLSPYGMV